MFSLQQLEVFFPNKAKKRAQSNNALNFVFETGSIDVILQESPEFSKLIIRGCNPDIKSKPLKIRFKVDTEFVHIPTWLHNPPVYRLNERHAFSHFGLPQRTGVAETAYPFDIGYAICLDAGKDAPATMINCETTEKGLGIETGPDGLVFCFLDGTDRLAFELEFTVIPANNLLECLDKYRNLTPYHGITGKQAAPIMWFTDWSCFSPDGNKGYPDLNKFKEEVKLAKQLGVEYVVEETFAFLFDEKFWSPHNAKQPAKLEFHKQMLDILTDADMKPLMYWNSCWTNPPALDDPEYGLGKQIRKMAHNPADNWRNKKIFEKNYQIDMNWWSNGKPYPSYSVDTHPTMDMRCPKWREWLCERIKKRLKDYPQLAGTYIDTWPAGLPMFAGCNNAEHKDDYGENEWWNAIKDFMWQIREATKSAGSDKVLMINDSRMPKKVLEACDLILNEDDGPVKDPQKAFWHCFRSAAVRHTDHKPSFQFHHWKKGMNNALRTQFYLAFAAFFGLEYCIWHQQHYAPGPEGATVQEYYQTIRDLQWLFGSSPEKRSITISSETGSIEKMSFEIADKKVHVDFAAKKLKIK